MQGAQGGMGITADTVIASASAASAHNKAFFNMFDLLGLGFELVNSRGIQDKTSRKCVRRMPVVIELLKPEQPWNALTAAFRLPFPH